MTDMPILQFERLVLVSARRVANEMFLDCCEDLHDTDMREELISVGRAGTRSAVIDLAGERGIGAQEAVEIAAMAEAAFELHLSKLLLSQMRGEA